MDNLLYYHDIDVGEVFTSAGRTVTEADVQEFASMTGDFTPLHVDHDYASNTPFKQPIAHGLLGLSLLAGLSSRCPNVATAAFVSLREWKFLRPIYFGDQIYAATEVIEKRPHGRRRGEVIWQRQLFNQDGYVVQSGVFETLVEQAPAEISPTKAKPQQTPAYSAIAGGQRKTA